MLTLKKKNSTKWNMSLNNMVKISALLNFGFVHREKELNKELKSLTLEALHLNLGWYWLFYVIFSLFSSESQ
jgi:hypothetical protein